MSALDLLFRRFVDSATATASDILAGLGLGFVNAETLGPIITDVKADTAAALAAGAPIGAYMLWPWYAKAPPPNWLLANGQHIAIADYPALAALLPAFPKGLGQSNPVAAPFIQSRTGISSGATGISSWVSATFFEGNKLVTLQNNYATLQDFTTGYNVEGVVATNCRAFTSATMYYDGASNEARPILRDNNELVYLSATGSTLYHLNLNNAVGTQVGPSTSMPEPATGGEIYNEGFYKLTNGDLLFIQCCQVYQGRAYMRTWKLPANAAAGGGGWTAVDPFTVASMPSPQELCHFQLPDGSVCLVTRASGTTGNYTFYRMTTGGWVNIGNAALPVSPSVRSTRRRESAIKRFSHIETSSDGTQIIVNIGAGFLVSTNSGASFTFRTIAQMLPNVNTGINGDFDLSSNSSTVGIGFCWEASQNRWVFVSMVTKRGFATANQQFLVVHTGTTPGGLAKVAEIQLGNAYNRPSSVASIYLTNGFFCFAAFIGADNYGIRVKIPRTGGWPTTLAFSTGAIPTARYAGFPFDGIVALTTSPGVLLWALTDDSEEIYAPQDTNQQSYPLTEFSISSDGLRCAAVYYRSDIGYTYSFAATVYAFNPATQRKIPALNIPSASISETLRAVSTGVKGYIRAK